MILGVRHLVKIRKQDGFRHTAGVRGTSTQDPRRDPAPSRRRGLPPVEAAALEAIRLGHLGRDHRPSVLDKHKEPIFLLFIAIAEAASINTDFHLGRPIE